MSEAAAPAKSATQHGQSARFSVIVVHRNGAETLLRTLEALAKAVDPARDAVFVVDNGSSDDSLDHVRTDHPAVKIIENGCNMGYAAAINQAVPRSRSAFLLFLNNDAFVPADLLDRLAALFDANPRAGVIGPLLVSPDGTPQRSFGVEPTIAGEAGFRPTERRRPPLPARKVAPVSWISGACMAARRSAIDDAGSIDGGFFFYFEDVEWCIRLRRAGWQALLDQATPVVHEMGTSTSPVRRAAQVEALRSRLRLYRKIFSPRAAAVLTVVRLLRLVVNAAAHLLLTVLTLGIVPKVRGKFLDYAYVLTWWVMGRPDNWGLPGKCPQRQRRSRSDQS